MTGPPLRPLRLLAPLLVLALAGNLPAAPAAATSAPAAPAGPVVAAAAPAGCASLPGAGGAADPAGGPGAGSAGAAARFAGGASAAGLADTPGVTASELRAVQRRLRLGSGSTVRLAPPRTGPVVVKVHVHVISGKTVRGPRKARVARQLDLLNAAYDGAQSVDNTVTGFSFRQVSFERVRKPGWHRARMEGRADHRMRRALHRGGVAALNVYILAPRPARGQGHGTLLGWSSLPFQARQAVSQDGISLHYDALPGGRFTGYNEGDTLVHEAGHWLGLLHTFEGGCSLENDLVADTPAQADPSYGCPEGADTCAIDGPGRPDPIHNFMDYSIDPCMDQFTPGQVDLMQRSWTEYRTRLT